MGKADASEAKYSSVPLFVAALCGFMMALAGAFLAYSGKPEPSLVWSGAALMVVGAIGDRLSSITVTKDGMQAKFIQEIMSGIVEQGTGTGPSDQRPSLSIASSDRRLADFDEDGAESDVGSSPALSAQRRELELLLAVASAKNPRELGRLMRKMASERG
jgi:hypothetical protein